MMDYDYDMDMEEGAPVKIWGDDEFKREHDPDQIRASEVVFQTLSSMLGLVIGFAQITINLIFIGMLNNEIYQDAIGLGNIFINFIGVGIFFGINGGFDTLASQALGLKDYIQCGFYLQQGRIIICCFYLPIAVLMVYSKELLLALGQDPEVAAEASKFLLGFLPGMLLMGLNDLSSRLLI